MKGAVTNACERRRPLGHLQRNQGVAGLEPPLPPRLARFFFLPHKDTGVSVCVLACTCVPFRAPNLNQGVAMKVRQGFAWLDPREPSKNVG